MKKGRQQVVPKKQMSFQIYGMLRDAVDGKLPQLGLCDNRILRACLGREYFKMTGPKTVHVTPTGLDAFDEMRLAHAAMRNKSGPLANSVLAYATYSHSKIYQINSKRASS